MPDTQIIEYGIVASQKDIHRQFINAPFVVVFFVYCTGPILLSAMASSVQQSAASICTLTLSHFLFAIVDDFV